MSAWLLFVLCFSLASIVCYFLLCYAALCRIIDAIRSMPGFTFGETEREWLTRLPNHVATTPLPAWLVRKFSHDDSGVTTFKMTRWDSDSSDHEVINYLFTQQVKKLV